MGATIGYANTSAGATAPCPTDQELLTAQGTYTAIAGDILNAFGGWFEGAGIDITFTLYEYDTATSQWNLVQSASGTTGNAPVELFPQNIALTAGTEYAVGFCISNPTAGRLLGYGSGAADDTNGVAGTSAPQSPFVSTGTDGNSPYAIYATVTNINTPILASVNDGSLRPPVQTAPATAATGGTLGAATYYYLITAQNAYGESLPSNEESITTTGTTSTVTLNFTLPPGAVTGNIYRGTASGQERFLVTVGQVSTYTDTGAVSGTATNPPTANTTQVPIAEGATGVAITGAALATGQTVAITQGSNSVPQSAVTISSGTAGTFDLVMEPAIGSDLAFTDAVYSASLAITDLTYGASNSVSVALAPGPGLLFKTVTAPNATALWRVRTIPDLAANDQIEAAGDAGGTTAAPAGLVLNYDGSFDFAAGHTPQNFYARVYVAADSAWTPYALQTVSGERTSAQDFI